MAIQWENNGSCQDLSSLAKNSLTVTSQAGGNMTSGTNEAMTAPGSEPVDPLPDRKQQYDPHLEMPANQQMPGDDGKPRTAASSSLNTGSPAWGRIRSK